MYKLLNHTESIMCKLGMHHGAYVAKQSKESVMRKLGISHGA